MGNISETGTVETSGAEGYNTVPARGRRPTLVKVRGRGIMTIRQRESTLLARDLPDPRRLDNVL